MLPEEAHKARFSGNFRSDGGGGRPSEGIAGLEVAVSCGAAALGSLCCSGGAAQASLRP